MMNLEELTDEEYFGALKTMFASEGWKVLMAELADNATNINSVEDTTDGDDLQFRKGQLAVLGNLLNTERTIRIAEEEAQMDAIAENADAPD